jgi:putative PIN family toxin of toxin-antitoxin system
VRRAVLDPGVFVSALINPNGSPARLVFGVRRGELDSVASPLLLAELEGVLRREKFRRYASLEVVSDYVELVRRISLFVSDPEGLAPLRSADPKDDYLIALAHAQSAVLVSGDRHLLELGGGAPILAPADLLGSSR